MEVEDVITKKEKLEESIRDMLLDFKKETGTIITDVNLSFIDLNDKNCASDLLLGQVKLKCEIR